MIKSFTNLAKLSLSLLTLSFSTACLATNLSVSPTSLSLDVDERAVSETLIIRNADSEDTTMQVIVKRWDQSETGEFVLLDTDELLALPSTLKMPANSSRKIRIVHKKKNLPTPGSAQYYRVIVKELPKLDKQTDATVLKFTVGFSVPLYVTNEYDAKSFVLKTSFDKAAKKLTLTNTGTAHFKGDSLLAGELEFSGLTYLLPSRSIQINLNDAAVAAFSNGAPLRIMSSDHGTLDVPVQ